jgi:hypothetical protein
VRVFKPRQIDPSIALNSLERLALEGKVDLSPRQPIPARARASGLACHRLLRKGVDSSPIFAERARLCLHIDR